MAGPTNDGPGPSPSIGGTAGGTTVVGGGSLTSTALVTGGGATTLQTPSATSTLSAGGNLSIAGTITSASTITAGQGLFFAWTGRALINSPADGKVQFGSYAVALRDPRANSLALSLNLG